MNKIWKINYFGTHGIGNQHIYASTPERVYDVINKIGERDWLRLVNIEEYIESNEHL